MKSKLLRGILLSALAVALLTPSSLADSIAAPRSDFFEAHYEECTYVGRIYVAAGYEGKVTLFTSPENLTAEAEYENGTELRISFTWEDGEGYLWGVYDNYDSNKVGWLRMDDLALKYDSYQFTEDHQDELLQNTGLYPEGIRALAYTYPNSGEYQVLTEDWDYQLFSKAFSDGALYIDEAGRSWVSIIYYMGSVNGWVCVDDPLNESLNTGFVEPEQSVSQQRGSSAIEDMGAAMSRWQITLLAIVLVALVLVITLLIVKRFYPRKK